MSADELSHMARPLQGIEQIVRVDMQRAERQRGLTHKY